MQQNNYFRKVHFKSETTRCTKFENRITQNVPLLFHPTTFDNSDYWNTVGWEVLRELNTLVYFLFFLTFWSVWDLLQGFINYGFLVKTKKVPEDCSANIFFNNITSVEAHPKIIQIFQKIALCHQRRKP